MTAVHRICVSAALVFPMLAGLGCTADMGDGVHVDSLTGTVGEVSVQGVPNLHEVRIRDREVYIEVRLEDEFARTAMIGIEIPRDRALENEIGSTTLALLPEDAELVACSGPDPDDWDFDCRPDEFTVGIVEKGDRTEVEFGASFSAGACGDRYIDPEDEPTIYGEVEVDDLI